MKDNFIEIAKIGAPYGVSGDLKLYPSTEDTGDILKYKDILIKIANSYKPLPDSKIRKHGNGFLIAFKNCRDCDEARQYTNLKLFIDSADLLKLKPGQYYWRDLIGLNVINTKNEVFGVVDYLIETGSNDVLVVKGEVERLIPYLKDIVLAIDLDKKQIIVDWELDYS